MFLILDHELFIEKDVVQLLINNVQKCWHVIHCLVQKLQDKSNDFYSCQLEFLIVHVHFFTFGVEAL